MWSQRQDMLSSARVHATHALLALLLCSAAALPVRAGLLTAVEKNAFVVGETAAMTVSMMQDVYGLSSDVIKFDSTSFSATVWAFDMTGTYGGRSVGLSFTGIFDPLLNQGSYTGTGSIDADTWDGVGAWNYVDLAADTDGLNFDSTAIINGITGLIFDRHTIAPKIEQTFDNGTTRHTISKGQYKKTFFGVQYGEIVDQTDDSFGSSKGGQIASVTVSLTQDRVFLVGGFDQDGGRIAGNVQFIPEPSSLLLVGIALAGLVFGARRCSPRVAPGRGSATPA